jgi:hypothetical protein
MCSSCGDPRVVHGNNRSTSEGGYGEGDGQRPLINTPREEEGTEDAPPE